MMTMQATKIDEKVKNGSRTRVLSRSRREGSATRESEFDILVARGGYKVMREDFAGYQNR